MPANWSNVLNSHFQAIFMSWLIFWSGSLMPLISGSNLRFPGEFSSSLADSPELPTDISASTLVENQWFRGIRPQLLSQMQNVNYEQVTGQMRSVLSRTLSADSELSSESRRFARKFLAEEAPRNQIQFHRLVDKVSRVLVNFLNGEYERRFVSDMQIIDESTGRALLATTSKSTKQIVTAVLAVVWFAFAAYATVFTVSTRNQAVVNGFLKVLSHLSILVRTGVFAGMLSVNDVDPLAVGFSTMGYFLADIWLFQSLILKIAGLCLNQRPAAALQNDDDVRNEMVRVSSRNPYQVLAPTSPRPSEDPNPPVQPPNNGPRFSFPVVPPMFVTPEMILPRPQPQPTVPRAPPVNQDPVSSPNVQIAPVQQNAVPQVLPPVNRNIVPEIGAEPNLNVALGSNDDANNEDAALAAALAASAEIYEQSRPIEGTSQSGLIEEMRNHWRIKNSQQLCDVCMESPDPKTMHDECFSCLENGDTKNPWQKLNTCIHGGHKKCLYDWLAKKPQRLWVCPTCETPLIAAWAAQD